MNFNKKDVQSDVIHYIIHYITQFVFIQVISVRNFYIRKII